MAGARDATGSNRSKAAAATVRCKCLQEQEEGTSETASRHQQDRGKRAVRQKYEAGVRLAAATKE